MHRSIIYPGQVPLETDLLYAEQQFMVALAKMAAAAFGTSTVVNGLAATQTTVASMSVQIAAGEIYQTANLEATAYSSIAADTTHTVTKQGINLDPVALPLTAPGTVGFSINYLIQATFAETDAVPVVLPYYNASNPSTAYSGPANSGTAQNTRRLGTVTLSAKAGVAAASGTQTTPAADAGYVGLWVVTVAYGQTTITAPNIAMVPNAPFLPSGGLLSGVLGLAADLLNNTLAPKGAGQVGFGAGVAYAAGSLGYALKNHDASYLVSGDIAAARLTSVFASSHASAGYQVLPTGLIFQWGSNVVGANTVTSVTLPLTFPNSFYQAYASADDTSTTNDFRVGAGITSLSQIQLVNGEDGSSRTVRWFAIGR